jgi:tRNA A-37 threonylcarbamoyl transferase component Bud32/tetratricopeptide (TPR) repeat protein
MAERCLDERTVMLFLRGELVTAERADMEAHLATCAKCIELMTWAAAEIAGGEPGRQAPAFLGQLAAGSLIGRYQILGPIGRGAMGEVYAAYHPDLDRRVAVKVVYESGADSTERRARLLREAKAIARLSHPNVVMIHDAGTVGDRVFVVMEYVEGETLDLWLRARKRSWREVLDVFAAAGQGLAAAHAAQIVHRDFKPQNVMVGVDGVARVMDFGLARLIAEDLRAVPGLDVAAPAAPAAVALEDPPTTTVARVTQTGALLGTPAYMAPEQFRGESADARADQFSFCVAAHEGIFGVRPVLEHLPDRLRAVEAQDEAAGRAARARVPVWVRKVLLRGLASDPNRRYPSMRALLAELDIGRRARWRRRGAAVAALAVSLGAIAVVAARPKAPVCRGGVERLAGTWQPAVASPRRQAIHDRFVASGRGHAEQAFAGIAHLLDDYTSRWLRMYTDACEATQIRGEQSAEVLDLRMNCLQQRLTAVRAVVDVFGEADGQVVDNAVQAAGAMPDLDWCADVSSLKAVVKPPRDTETKKRVEELERERARLGALQAAGRCAEAVGLAAALLPEIRKTGYQPLLADALNTSALLADACVDPARGLEQYHEAFTVALSSRHDLAAAEAATQIAGIGGVRLGRVDVGWRWLEISRAMTARIGGHPRLEGWQLNNEAGILAAEHKWEASLELNAKAHALKERVFGKDHPDTQMTALSRVIGLAGAGRHEEALRVSDRVRADAARVFGPGHPWVAFVYSNQGESLNALHRYAEARAAFEQAVEIWRRAGSDPFFLSYGLIGLGLAHLGEGRPDAALAPLEEALQIRVAKQVDPEHAGEARFAVARALWHRAGDRERARALAVQARADYGRAPKGAEQIAAQIAAIDAWLRASTARP